LPLSEFVALPLHAHIRAMVTATVANRRWHRPIGLVLLLEVTR
jgi:hypothetical protein